MNKLSISNCNIFLYAIILEWLCISICNVYNIHSLFIAMLGILILTIFFFLYKRLLIDDKNIVISNPLLCIEYHQIKIVEIQQFRFFKPKSKAGSYQIEIIMYGKNIKFSNFCVSDKKAYNILRFLKEHNVQVVVMGTENNSIEDLRH